MEKDIFEILTEYAINKRLDAVLLKDQEYQEAQKEISSLTEQFKQLELPKEQRLIVDRLMSSYMESGCCYGKTAYQQGLKDGALLLRKMELIR